MSEITLKLSKAEALLVEIAHNDANLGHRNVEQILQGRLATITGSHDIPDGTEVRFVKEDDGTINLIYQSALPDLRLYDENGIAAGADATASHE